MENTENKNQELQEFAIEVKNEMEALIEKALNEMHCIFEKAMEKQAAISERNMAMFRDVMNVMHKNQQETMFDLIHGFQSSLQAQNEALEHFMMSFRDELKSAAEQRLDEMKTLRADIVYNLTKMRTESTKYE